MATFIEKVREGWRVFKTGYPDGARLLKPSVKGAPFMVWPEWQNARASWRMIDLQSYIEEGFGLNTLIYSAVMYKARAAATAPLRAYTGDPDAPELLPPDHPLAKLVARPNPDQSWREFQMLRTVYFNLAGESFVWLERKGGERGVPVAAYVLNPQKVSIIPDRKGSRGVIGYVYTPDGHKEGYPLVAQDVIHTKLPNPLDPLEGDGYGFSPVSPLARSGDVDNMITQFLQIFFERGAVVTGLLKFDRPMMDEQIAQVKERWKAMYGGYENWSEIGVLDLGGEYQRISTNFDEMGFDSLDERNETRILGPFGVPPILIGSRIGLLRSTYANYGEARSAFWEDTMLSELGLFEDDYRYYLQSDDGGFVQFDYSGVPALRRDIAPLVTAWATMVDRGVPKNVAAQVVGLKLPELSDGNVIYMPLNLVPVNEQGEPAAPQQLPPPAEEQNETNDGAAEAEEDAEERGEKANKAGLTPEQKAAHWKAVDRIARSYEPKFETAAAEAFENDRRECLALVGGGKAKSLERKATVDWEEIAGEVDDYLQGASVGMWRKLFVPLVRGLVIEQGKRWSANLGMQFNVTNLDAADWFNKYTLKFAQAVSDTTRDNIARIMARAQLDGASIPAIQKQLDALFDVYAKNILPDDPDWQWLTDRTPAYRKEMIARTETIRASSAGSAEQFKQWGLKKKEWIATPDDRVRDEHLSLNGEVVGIDDTFDVGGYPAQYPADPALPPEMSINCRCSLLPVLEG